MVALGEPAGGATGRLGSAAPSTGAGTGAGEGTVLVVTVDAVAGGRVVGVEVGPADEAGPPPQPTVSAANSTHQSGLTDSRTRTGQV